MLVYRVLRRILGFVVSVFFRQVEVTGEETLPDPATGPVLFAGNHPNSLLDPVLILITCGRVVHFAAKDVLFKGVLRPILKQLGAVPVARKSDHKEGAVDNESAFQALGDVLSAGRAMGIFPEGLSHDESQLMHLKTGAARIALDVAVKRGVRVRIVPCGLNYVRRRRFRSRVLVQYGPPIAITDAHLAAFHQDERQAVRALTVEIEQAMRALTVNASDWQTLTVLDAVRRLYQPPSISLAERTELARRFNDVYPKVKDEPEVAAFISRVARFIDRLRAVGLSDRDLLRTLSVGEIAQRIGKQLVLGFVWLPLAAPGIVLHAPLGLFISWAGRRFTPRKDVIATTKFILGLVMLPLVYGAILLAIGLHYGLVAALVSLAVLVLSGFATVRVFERGARLTNLLVACTRAFALRDEVASLRAERAELAQEIVKLVARHIPSDMTPLFPRGA